MKANFELGICFNNTDPQNRGRIRAILLSDVVKFFTKNCSLIKILAYTDSKDANAVVNNTYLPWNVSVIGQTKQIDSYLCDSFLPKHIGITPRPGQLIKIVNYETADKINEFIGPFTTDSIDLNEEYRTIISNIQKNIDISQAVPQRRKTYLSGYKNEQVILGENEILLRLNHIDQNKKRKSTYPFIQLSQFDNSYEFTEKEVDVVEQTDYPIDYICDLSIEYIPKTTIDEKNIKGTLLLYKEKDLTSKTFEASTEYKTKDYTDFYVKHIITTNSFKNLTDKVTEILENYKNNGKVAYFDKSKLHLNDQKTVTDTTIIQTINNLSLQPNAGGAVNTSVEDSATVSSMKNWIFRLYPNTNISQYSGSLTPPNVLKTSISYINYVDYSMLDSLISNYKIPVKYGKLNQKEKTSKVKQKVGALKNEEMSGAAFYADKFIFLSSKNTPSLISDSFFDGMSPDKFFRAITNNIVATTTYGIIRGEKELNLINNILNIILKHGHDVGKNPSESIDSTSSDTISSMIKDIKDSIKINNNGDSIINHNFRIN